jgi:hypothetical protein
VDARQPERLVLRVLAILFGDVPIAAACEVVQMHDGVIALATGGVGHRHRGDALGDLDQLADEEIAFFA